jgi:hypothetical protein
MWGLWYHHALSVRLCEPFDRVSWNSAEGYAIERYFKIVTFYPVTSIFPKMANVQTSEVDEKLVPVNVEPWTVKISNHGNHTILVWRLKIPYLCKGSIFGHIV